MQEQLEELSPLTSLQMLLLDIHLSILLVQLMDFFLSSGIIVVIIVIIVVVIVIIIICGSGD